MSFIRLKPLLRPTHQIHRAFSTTKEGPSKTKTFMKKYGYVGIGVYTALSIVDLATTMTVISVKGAEKALKAEHYVMGKVKHYLNMEHTPLDPAQFQEKPSFTSLFLIAYGIHKTVLLPVRLSLTAAITPMVAKRLKALGWIQRTVSK